MHVGVVPRHLIPGHLTRAKTTHLTRLETPRLADAPGNFLWYTGSARSSKEIFGKQKGVSDDKRQ